ncbi:MAG: hypothetical protein U0835_04480 [Isosphaeraceae bacterium]
MSESEAAPEPETAETPENDPEPQVEEDDSESLPTGAVLARVAGDQLYRLSMVAQLGVIVAGGSLVLVAAGTGEGAAGSLKTVLAIALAVVRASWWARPSAASGALLHVQADSADATGRIEQRISDSLERLERTLEALAEAPRACRPLVPSRSGGRDPPGDPRNGRWEDAQSLLGSLSDERPDDPDVARLAEELASARHAAAQELLAKVEAARGERPRSGDPSFATPSNPFLTPTPSARSTGTWRAGSFS